MELLNPTRITSLESYTIRVIHHTSPTSQSEFVLRNVFPFETLFHLKQRIALHFGEREGRTYLPSNVLLAQEAPGGFRTLEFYWSDLGKVLPNPLANPGKVDTRIYESGARKGSVFPTILTGISVEAALTATATTAATEQTLHMWSLKTLLEAAGFSALTPLKEDVFHGYFSLYFPLHATPEEVVAIFKPLGVPEKEAFQIATEYRAAMDARLAKVEEGLKAPSVRSAANPQIRDLRLLRYNLPKNPLYTTSVLELKFYEITPSASMPFVRFFPYQDKIAPLIKLAKGSTGVPLINDPKLLDLFMLDEPPTKEGAVMMIKTPIKSGAPFGTCWTLRIFEDGTADLKIGAPRKDAPLSLSHVNAAFDVLPELLVEAGWTAEAPLTLADMTATYLYKTRAEEKPTKAELKARLDAFLPFFYEEKLPEGSRATLALRYRAVSNFDEEENPYLNHLSMLFLRESNASTNTLSREVYLASLIKHFGLSPAESSAILDEWTAKRAEYILEDRETAIASLQLGSAITIGTSNYPNYAFFVSSVESFKDLQRILSLLSVFATLPSQQLRHGGTEQKPATEVLEAVADAIPEAGPAATKSPNVPDATLTQFDDFGDFGGFDTMPEEAVVEEPKAAAGAASTTTAAPPEPVVEIAKDIELPDLLGKDEIVGSVSDKWYLDRLVGADKDLFAYSVPKGDVRSKTYSVSCQKSSNKQPFVMTAENYAHARALYGDDVSWVEAPLDPYDLTAATLVSKTLKQRKGFSDEEIYDYEIRALQLGFPLKGDESVTLSKDDAPAEKKAIVQELMTEQKSKPLWTIVRAGTNPDHPNYYICATLWCIRDELPLIPAEFEGTTLRRGGKKPKESCAFCGGKLIQDLVHPKVGETVLVRGASAKTTSKVAQYVGFPKDLVHPDGYPTPCCFVDPDNLKVPDGARPIPPPVVALPSTQVTAPPKPATKVADVEEEAAAAVPTEPASVVPPPVADENRDRPFSQTTLRTGAQNKWYIPNQNIVGRTATEWYELGKGDAGVPPPSVNALLGQNPATFLTATKGALGVSINSYLKAPGSAFVRYGLGSTGFLGLVAFAQYACSALVRDPNDLVIGAPETIFKMLFEDREIRMVHAFEQANYGTLVHEFGVGRRPLEEVKFQTWCGEIGIELPAQRAYAEQLYNAWHNFKDYVRNPAIPKELRLFEGLLATPQLMTETGCLLVRIKVPEKSDEPATIECPAFGVSLKDYFQKPPLLFVVEDEARGALDPLVFFDASSESDKRLYGALQYETPLFGKISEDARTALLDFIQQYYNPISGCGRKIGPVHPWSPVLESSGLPRLRDFVRRLDGKAGGPGGDFELRLVNLLRDRSNRLVGAIVRPKKNRGVGNFYVPLLDDGTILSNVSSVHGEEALPKPELSALLDLFMGARYPPADGKLASQSNFPGLLPVKLVNDKRNYVALILRSGAYVPFKPFALNSDIRHARFMEMKETGAVVDIEVGDGDMPWDTDIALLGPAPPDAETLQTTSEEVLNEAYQHLRLSFSNWLNLTPAGANVKKQIELLRRARHRLPLWELQKRLDVLLTPIVSNSAKPWITTEGSSSPSLLRRDCLQIRKKDDCSGGCTWSPAGRCLIHTTATPRYIDPVRVMTARLVDELLRTFGQAQEILEKHVAYLKPLPQDAIVKEGESLLFSAVGRGSDPLFKRLGYMGRKPTQFSAGLTYPEEVDIVPDEKVSVFNLPASWTAVFKHAVFGADVARDALARRTAAVVSIARASGETEDIASRLRGIPFDGSSLFWREFAKAYDVEVLTTSYDPLEKITKLEGWYAGVPRKGREAQKFVKQYVVLDVEGIPLQRIDNGTFLSQEAGLPATIRLWLESHVPMEKPIAAAAPTTHGGVPETKENDEDVAAAVPAIAPVIAPVIPAAPPPVAKKDEKACPPEQILNPATGKCVKRDGVIGKKLVKALADVQPAIGEEVAVVAAPPQVQKDRAGNPCPPGTIFNPDSQRISTDCVKRDGKKGKEILAAAAAAAPALPALPALPAAAPAPIPAVEELVAAEPALVAEAAPPMKLARCPPGTRRSKKTGNCEPTKA